MAHAEESGAPPAVSVVVTCCDLGRYLDEAVSSALAQTFDDFEILIVDDGSTDAETCRLLADYRRPHTRVLRGERSSLAAARNRGIREARGRYLCALDADDRLHPRFLEKTLARLECEPSLTFVSTWLRAFGTEDWLWCPERCDLETLLAECTVMTAALVRREAVLAVGGYDEAMPAPGHEDWDLWLTLVERGHRGEIRPEVLFDYRRRPGSVSSICDFGRPHLELTRYLVEKHAASYRRYLDAVLVRREDDIGAMLRENDRIERQITTWLEPQIARRHQEAEALRRRLAAVPAGDARPAEAAHQVAGLQAEVAALRESWSWRVTAPLRAVYELLRGSRVR